MTLTMVAETSSSSGAEGGRGVVMTDRGGERCELHLEPDRRSWGGTGRGWGDGRMGRMWGWTMDGGWGEDGIRRGGQE